MDVDNMQAVIDAARLGQPPLTLASGKHFQIVWTPKGGVETVNVEGFNPHPYRKKGTITVFDPESFNRVLADNVGAGHITIYVNPDANKPAIVAVMNGAGPNGPGWGDFRVSIGFRETPQWAKWKSIDGKLLPQTEFAEFVEDNLADIATPAGADIMEIVTYLQATRTANFRSGVKLSSGAVQFANEEVIEAQVGAGNIAVPDMFELALSPMFGVQPFKVPARFRFRMQDRKLMLGLKLQRVEDIMSKIIEEMEIDIVPPEGAAKVYGLAP